MYKDAFTPATYTPFAKPTKPAMRLPGNGLMGQFDMNQVMETYRQLYPQANPQDLLSTANAAVGQAQMARKKALQGFSGGGEQQMQQQPMQKSERLF